MLYSDHSLRVICHCYGYSILLHFPEPSVIQKGISCPLVGSMWDWVTVASAFILIPQWGSSNATSVVATDSVPNKHRFARLHQPYP